MTKHNPGINDNMANTKPTLYKVDIDADANTNSQKQQKLFQRYFNKALHYQSQNKIYLALELYDKALQHNNNHLPTLQVLATLFHEIKHFNKALHYYTRAAKLHAHSSTLQNGLGNCHEHCQQWQEAKSHYLNAIELRQDYAEALSNLGNICRKMGDYQQAEFNLLRSLRLCISVPTLLNLGLLMSEMHNDAQALSFYDHALRIQPFNHQVKWHKARLLLTQGQFKQGWDLYCTHGSTSTHLFNVLKDSNHPKVNPHYFHDKIILIRGNQNISNEVMLASCIPEVILQSKKCYVECDSRLFSLFQRSFPRAEIIPKLDNNQRQIIDRSQAIDITISLTNIAKILRQSFNDFSNQSHYLTASIKDSHWWQQRLTHCEHKNMKVGITWRSNVNDEMNSHCYQLKNWNEIFVGTDCQLINLQHGQVQSELNQLTQQVLNLPEYDHQFNLDQLAAQISALDLVISSNNVVAHIAGALGKPVWIILPYATDWQWFRGKNPCPWHNSALIFKQESPKDCLSLFQNINKNLLIMQQRTQTDTASETSTMLVT